MENILMLVHLIGVVFGAGGVTTAYVRKLYFQKHPEEASKKGSLPVITPMVNIGFVLLILSGIGLYLGSPEKYNNLPAFWVKMALVLILLMNHIFINAYLRQKQEQLPTLSKIAEYVSVFGWYVIIAVSVLL